MISQSQISQIVDPLMFGGKIQASARNSNCVLVATEGGIFKTTNQGQSWTNAIKSLNSSTVNCDQIVNIGTEFYAKTNSNNGANIYKGTADGVSWTPLSYSFSWVQAMGKLANTLYVVGGSWDGGRLYASTNGVDWTAKAIVWTTQWMGGNCNLFSFAQDKMYLDFNNNLYYTTDGNTLITISVTGLGITQFSDGDSDLDGDALGNLYYRNGNVVYKYNFTTDVWSDISTGKIPVEYQIMQFSATDNALFVVAMTPTIGLKLYKSTDQGNSFTDLLTTGLDAPMIGNIIDVSANGLIGNGLDDGIVLSSDGGNSWTTSANQYIATYAGNLTRSENTLLYSMDTKGVIQSTTQGLTWNTANNGIPNFGGIAYFVDYMIQVRDTLFAWVRPEPFSDAVVLFKSATNGSSWTSSPIPAPYDNGENYSFAGKCDSALFVNFYDKQANAYALIATFNYGKTWVKPNNQFNLEQIYMKGPKNCLFAFMGSMNNWDGFSSVSRANSFGMSFTDLNANGLFNSNFTIKRLPTKWGERSEAMMDFNPNTNKAIFAVRDRMMGNDIDRLYLYDITTNSWSEMMTVGLPLNYISNCIYYNGNNVWLLATNFGLYKSTNGGINWTITHNENDWQQGIVVNSIQTIGNKAFLGTISNGVWVADLSLGGVEHAIDKGMRIYPNPTADYIHGVLPEFDGTIVSVMLVSIDGKRLMNQTIKGAEFDLNLRNLPAGCYVLVVNMNHHIYRKTIIRK